MVSCLITLQLVLSLRYSHCQPFLSTVLTHFCACLHSAHGCPIALLLHSCLHLLPAAPIPHCLTADSSWSRS
jgi:hypothetical protein